MDSFNSSTATAQVHSGNRCGHDPGAPRWFDPPSSHARRPGILRKLSERLRDYYRAPRKFIPSLDTANGSDRQQRSERREACLALLGCIVHYSDLVTLRVGIPQADGSFAGLTMPFLAELSGLGERRAERAIHDLKIAGLVTVHPICKRLDDCAYKGVAAIRALSAKAFDIFGLGRWLRHERDKAAARRRKKRRNAEAADAAKATLPLGRIGAVSQRDTEPERKGALTPMSEFFAGIKATLKGGGGPP